MDKYVLLSWEDYRKLKSNQTDLSVHTNGRAYFHSAENGLIPADQTTLQSLSHTTPSQIQQTGANTALHKQSPPSPQPDEDDQLADDPPAGDWFDTWEGVSFKK